MGIEFVLTTADDEQNLYIIDKRYRSSPIEATTISVFYILNGVIFQAPTLKKIIDSKV